MTQSNNSTSVPAQKKVEAPAQGTATKAATPAPAATATTSTKATPAAAAPSAPIAEKKAATTPAVASVAPSPAPVAPAPEAKKVETPVSEQKKEESVEDIESLLADVGFDLNSKTVSDELSDESGSESKTEAKDSVISEFRNESKTSDSASLEDTLGELEADMGSLSGENTVGNGEGGHLSMRLSGEVGLNLVYECSGQEIQISFREQCLYVELQDGSEFKIPLNKKSTIKLAA